MNKILKNIRNNNIKGAIGTFIPALILTGCFILILYMLIFESEDFEIWYLIILGAFGLFGYFADAAFVRCIQLAIDPLKDDVFKKYGSPDKIGKILDEIEKSKLYEDNFLIISKNYISDKTDYSKIVACNDVLGVHKLVHKTNYVIDYYQIVITDKYNQTTTYRYGRKEEDKVNNLLMIIGSICHNAELGYTQKEWENIKNNSVKLPDEIVNDNEDSFKSDNCGAIVGVDDKYCKNCNAIFEEDEEQIAENADEEELFKCDNCGAMVKESAIKCPNCGETFEEESETEEEEKKSDIDKKYSDLTKLKKLLDKEIITKEEFEKEKKKILNEK